MELTEENLKQLGTLARIQLSPSELVALSKQLENIINLVDQINDVPTDNIEATAHPVPGQVQRLREDVVTEPDDRKNLQALAPRPCEADLYLVPEVIQEA